MPTPPPLSLKCPHCGERLGVRADDMGKRGQCRSCGAVFRIGESRGKAAPAADASRSGAASQAAVAAPASERPPPTPAAPPTTTTFGCELCQTRLTAPLAEVGKAMKCPDCGRRNVIPAPPPPPVRKPPAAMSGKQFDLWGVDEAPLPAELKARMPVLHPVVCELCQTLMYATDAQVGKKLKCPDCGTATLARRRPPEKPRGPVIVPDGDEYQLDPSSAPPARPVYVSTDEYGTKWGPRAGRATPTEAEPEEGTPVATATAATARPMARRTDDKAATAKPPATGDRAPRPSAPRRVPMVRGLARMLFSGEVLSRWFASSLVLGTATWLISWVQNAMSAQVFVALPMFAGGCMIAVAWAIVALPTALAIVTESSEGNDQLHDPPNWLAFDFGEAFAVLLAAAVSAIPAWLAAKAAAAAPWEAQLALAVAAWLFVFPIVLLSGLEQGSALAVFSPRLVSSLVHCPGSWLVFYIASAAMAAAIGGVAWAIAQGPPQLAAAAPWVAMAALYAYMRLIGRLGWRLAETMPAEEEAPTG